MQAMIMKMYINSKIKLSQKVQILMNAPSQSRWKIFSCVMVSNLVKLVLNALSGHILRRPWTNALKVGYLPLVFQNIFIQIQ